MKNSLLSFALVALSLVASAQTSHSVTVGSGMTYVPNQLTIVSGDNVTFTSEGGTHDVNFSTNSITGMSFDNPADIEYLPIQGAGLMGTITFNVPGTYNYDCSVYGHAISGMVGEVIVNASASNTVVDVIVGSPDHTTLEAAVIAAGLAETLSGDGPFTVFAPTDAAFALLADGTLEYLLANTGALTSILTHHVYGGIALSTDLSDGMMVTTLAGTSLTVSITDDGVYIDNAMVTVANIETDNGVVHVIDAVLIPTEDETNTVVDVIVGSPDHTLLTAAVIAAGLAETLSGDGPFTVFAPTDAAFALLPEGTLEYLLANTAALTSILTHHVYGGTALSTDLSDGMMVTTLAGTSLTVSITDDGVYIDNAMVTVANIEADNGVVHVIDAVLIPAEEETNTVVDVIVGSPDHTTLAAAVVAAGLVETLSGDGPFTVFAPTDAAFALLPEGTVEDLLADPTGALTSILTHHVYGGTALSTDLSDGMMVTTLAGTSLTVSITDEGVFIDNAMVTVANIETDNGVVHVIDAVLLPANLSIDEFLNVENGQYLYSIDVLGKRIKRTTLNRIIFDIYSSGNVVKRFSNK